MNWATFLNLIGNICRIVPKNRKLTRPARDKVTAMATSKTMNTCVQLIADK